MTINIDEIVEVIYRAPARFAKIFFEAHILVLKNKDVKIDIKTTFKHYGMYHVPLPNNSHEFFKTHSPIGWNHAKEEKNLEKFNQTGLALGTLEYYLNSQNYNFTKTIELIDNEIIAEYYIYHD